MNLVKPDWEILLKISDAQIIEGAVALLSFIFLWLGRMEHRTWALASQIKNHELICADRWSKLLKATDEIKNHLTSQDNRAQTFREEIIGQVGQLQGRNDAKDHTGFYDRGV